MGIIVITVMLISLGTVDTIGGYPMELWYENPARVWTEALPLGNGRIGAMVFGGIGHERISLNEDSLWSGGPQDADNPDAFDALHEIRRLLFEGKVEAADHLANQRLVCKGLGSGQGNGAYEAYGSYQTLGDLRLIFEEHEEAREYRRSLDLSNGLSHVSYRVGETRFDREHFVSAPDQAVFLLLRASGPKTLNLNVQLHRDPRSGSVPWRNDSGIEPFDTSHEKAAAVNATATHGGGLLMQGKTGGDQGMAYAAALGVLQDQGSCQALCDSLEIRGATSVLLVLSAATSFRSENPAMACSQAVASALSRPYEEARRAHVDEHRAWMDRTSLRLGGVSRHDMPTDKRLTAITRNLDDSGLIELFFQYGRYLLVASSRPGSLPANLQGIWCDHFQAPWNSDYHHNINDQMNYWPAETGNLHECHRPFLDFIATLVEPGKRTAEIHYGARGWVVHTISNIWGFTSPGEHPGWGAFSAAGGWLCRHLWEHYAFFPEESYLTWAYPILRESAQFYMDFLIEDPATGHLITGPSNSPENSYRTNDGQVARVCLGPAMDVQIIRDLFGFTIRASEILRTDETFREQLREARARLAPNRIGRYGQLQEWLLEDYEEPEPGHRHVSHLYALHPGDEITPEHTPELAAAAAKTLARRAEHGGGHTGWSRAWMINFAARLRNGNAALQHLQALLRKSTLPNLFDNHPPFQIDGNFGATSGIIEMLLQSHAGVIDLLPALPDAWQDGEVIGLRARDGFEVSIKWRRSVFQEGTIRSDYGKACRIRAPLPVRIFLQGEVIAEGCQPFETIPGQTYLVQSIEQGTIRKDPK